MYTKPVRIAMAALVTFLSVSTVVPLVAVPASAAVAPAVSATRDPVNGYPSWYQDATGIRVQPCLAGSNGLADPNCVMLASATYNPANPVVFPTTIGAPFNFPGEFFYQVADSEKIPTPGCAGTKPGSVFTRVGLEASFPPPNALPVPGQQVVFGRIRVRGTGLCPNTTYTFTHPYGTVQFTSDSKGIVMKGSTVDVGCLVPPCTFAEALASPVLGGFLKWDPAVAPAAPPGYLGDSVTLHTVVGSPFTDGAGQPANYFQVSAPGLAPLKTTRFTVSGKTAGPVTASPNSVDFGGQPDGTTSAAKTVTLTSLDPSAIQINASAITGTDATNFAVSATTCSAPLARDATCTVDLTFTPVGATAKGANLELSYNGARSPLVVPLAGTGTPVNTAPVISVAPIGLVFGPTRVVTQSPAQAVTVTNTGTAPLGINSVAFGGTSLDSSQFVVFVDSCTGRFVAAAASCVIDVAFAPNAAGTFTAATLDIASNDTAAPNTHVTLSGTGTGGLAAVSPPPNNPSTGYPTWYQDENGIRVQPCLAGPDGLADPKCVLLGTATAPYDPTATMVFPTNFPGEFFYQVADSDKLITPGCPSQNIAPGTATYRAGLEGTFFPAGVPAASTQIAFGRIRIVVQGGLCPNTRYTVTHPYGVEQITTDAFGSTPVNQGTDDVGCKTVPCNFALPLKSRVFGGLLQWDPAVAPSAPAGYLGDNLTLHPVVGSPYLGLDGKPANYVKFEGPGLTTPLQTDQFKVSGKLVGPLQASPTALNFGDQAISATSTVKTLVLSNAVPGTSITATSQAIVGTNAADFAIDSASTTCSAATPVANCTVGITFNPAAGGPRTARLEITNTGGNTPVSVPLFGSGASPGTSLSPTGLTFANQVVNTTSAPQTVTVTNDSSTSLAVASATISGANAGDFAVSSNTCATVAPGLTCTIDVTYTPLAVGTSNATLSVTDNAAGSPQTVALTGAGVTSDQTITFVNPGPQAFGTDFDVVPTASSGLAVSLTATGVCTVVGTNTIHATGVGSCTVTASQAGNAIFNAAANVVQAFTIGKGNQTITFPAIPKQRFGTPSFPAGATASSGRSVSYTASGACTVAGGVIALTNTGLCTIVASEIGDVNWNGAASVTHTFTVARGIQTIIFPAITVKSIVDLAFPAGATASSGLPVSYTATGVCTVAGGNITLTALGLCSVTASQAGNASWNAAPRVTRTFRVTKASQTITFPTIANQTVGSPDFALTATASSGLAVSYALTGPCRLVNATTVHILRAGMCTVTASQRGDAIWVAAPRVVRSFTIV